MPTLPLLFAVLFVAAVQAAVPTFGHNVVPFIPQVSQSLPVPISWAVPILPQSFFFDWNDPNFPLPNPTTGQCDTINIKWSRGDAQGYVAPNLADDWGIYPSSQPQPRFTLQTPRTHFVCRHHLSFTHDSLITFKRCDRAICHRCGERPQIRKLGRGSSFQCAK